MTLPSRWWAPSKPSDEPDEFSKALLKPAGDDADLGAAFLGLHRCVAGAIEKRVTDGLVDEVGLVQAMAGMREKVAADAVDVVSKHLPASYSGLLVRDFLDDAEAGALALYRAAVSKSVPPPAAAKRAAAVYGVPASKMGSYFSVATSPGARDEFVSDAADRALMTYVSKVVEEEKPGVSKALVGAELDRFNDVHVRDEEGRFAPKGRAAVRTSEPSRAAPERRDVRTRIYDRLGVDQVPRQLREVVDREQTRTSQQQRTSASSRTSESARTSESRFAQQGDQRNVRRTRRVRRTVADQQAQAPRTRETRAESRSSVPREVVQHRASVKRKLKDVIRQMVPTRPDEPVKIPRKTEDMREPLGTPSETPPEIRGTISEDVVAYVSGAEFRQSINQLRNETSGKNIARLGHLLGSENPTLLSNGTAAAAARFSSRHADSAHLDNDFAENGDVGVISRAINVSDIDKSGMDERTYINEITSEILGADTEGSAYVAPMMNYVPYGELDEDDIASHVVVQHVKGGSFDPTARRRPLESVAELIIHDASGEIVGSGRKGYLDLDNNQLYRVERDAGAGKMWDPDARTVVERYHLYPVDDYDIGKALAGAELQRFNELHVRDEDGRFADKAENRSRAPRTTDARAAGTRLAPSTRSSVQARSSESTRSSEGTRFAENAGQRRVRSVRRTVSEPTMRSTQRESVESTRETKARSAKARAIQRRLSADRAVKERIRSLAPYESPHVEDLEINADMAYRVAGSEQWKRLFDYLADDDIAQLHSGKPIKLEGMFKNALFELEECDAEQAVGVMNVMASNDIPPEIDEETYDFRFTTPVEMAPEMVPSYLEHLFRKEPDVSQVSIMNVGGMVEVTFTKAPLSTQTLIEMPMELDPDGEYELEYLGEKRALDLHGEIEGQSVPLGTIMDMMNRERGGEGVISNPTTRSYRVVAAKAHVYRQNKRD